MVDISVNTNGSISLSANNSSNINANTNGEAQRAKSWAVGTGLIDGLDYSSKYYALLAKQSEETATEAVETISISVEAAQGYAEDAASSAEYIVNHAPTVTVEQTETGATITATDMQGTTTATLLNGTDGENGFSPIATVTKSGNVATITITDKNGTTTANVYDGSGGGTVDQTFDGTSTNAQSGVAIAGAGFINSSVLSAYATQSWVYSQTDAIMSAVNDLLQYRADLTLSNITSMGDLITHEFDQVYDELATKISGITSSDVTTALGYTPVNKAGDAMTGNLNFSNSGQSTIGLNGISTSSYADITYTDGSNNRLAHLRAYNDSSTKRRVELVVMNDNGSPAGNGVRVTYENSTESCEFPNTKCVDGQWVNNSVQLATNVSLAIGNNQRLEYDISSYLPNDNYSYEVRFSIDAQTGSGSGAGLNISLISKAYNNVDTWVRVCNIYARGSWAMVVGNSAIVPIGTDRKVKLNYTVISKTAQLNGLYIEAYRRIGTNT